jgi:hypothetical protein
VTFAVFEIARFIVCASSAMCFFRSKQSGPWLQQTGDAARNEQGMVQSLYGHSFRMVCGAYAAN